MSVVPQILQAGALAELDHTARALIAREAKGLKLPAGKTVFLPGDPCHHYVIVTSGSIRVSVTTEGGREIVLYRVESGETCVLTAACLFSGAYYEAEGRTETDTETVILPKQSSMSCSAPLPCSGNSSLPLTASGCMASSR